MIDKETGALAFGAGRLERTTGREDFLASPLGAEAELLIENATHRTYRVYATSTSGERFAVCPYFLGARLKTVTLSVSDERFGTASWDDWSEETERERKKWHDRWLRRACGISPGAEFFWGRVASDYDARAGSSSIRISYSA